MLTMADSLIGAQVRHFRKLRGLTTSELGEMIQSNHSYISQVENGKLMPSADALGRIARVLEVSTDILIGLAAPNDGLSADVMIEQIAARRGVNPEYLRIWIESLEAMPEENQEVEIEGARLKTKYWKSHRKQRSQEESKAVSSQAQEG